MISKGIIVYWDKAMEFISLDLDAIDPSLKIAKTIEYWYSTKSFVAYSTTSKISKIDNGHRIEIAYQHNLNRAIKKQDACWGHSIITIPRGAMEGVAEWKDDDFPKKFDGKILWKVIGSGLTKQSVKEVISRSKRNQTMLRQALIATGAECAITGEQTIEALEAAHIIPSSKNGAEVIENAVLLRADLHRLYDRNLFSIGINGQIERISENLSDHYKSILTGAQISQDAIERVELALLSSLVKANEYNNMSESCKADSR
jgi:hypothetical protein